MAPGIMLAGKENLVVKGLSLLFLCSSMKSVFIKFLFSHLSNRLQDRCRRIGFENLQLRRPLINFHYQPAPLGIRADIPRMVFLEILQ
jgi:hypothetical protein